MPAEKITLNDDKSLNVPDMPIIPFIEGDGIGVDIWPAAQNVVDSAVKAAYGGKRQIEWKEILAGEKAFDKTGEWLPQESLDAIKEYKVAIKGPLTTPVGGGIRSLNVTLRKVLDLYACVRPVRYFDGVPSPMKDPGKLDVVIFRENTEDVYSGVEFRQGTDEQAKLIAFLKKELGVDILPDSGIGIKPISITGTKRLVRKAIDYLIAQGRDNITLMHKGNIMKFTEGAFKDWGYELAREEYADELISEDDLWSNFDGKVPSGKRVIKDRIADNMLQQILTRTDEYDIIATPNLNGDYISDACAAQVGGLGLAPGANVGDELGVFEATHGTAPKYAGQDKVNPSSVILSGVLMFQYMGWAEVGEIIETALEKAILQKRVTYDLARQMDGNVKPLKTSEFGKAIIDNF